MSVMNDPVSPMADDVRLAVLEQAPALLADNRLTEAEALLAGVLARHPRMAEAHGNLGVALRRQGRLAEAEGHLRQALECRPDYPEALNNLGAVLVDMGRADEAVPALRAALALRPEHAPAWNNLGNALKAVGAHGEARQAYARALAIAPEYAEAHWNLALEDLLQGDFASGWREYEWRLARADTRHLYPDWNMPRWDGAAPDGRTILFYAEQGMGDTLQFARFLPRVAERGARVILRCQAPLKGLLEGLPGVAQVLDEDEALPHFDLQCPLLSLPYLLGMKGEDDIPPTPYLAADAGLAAAWGARLPRDGRLRVGLVWAGAPRREDFDAWLIDRRRSMRLADFGPLLDIPGVAFYSLQLGEAAAEARDHAGKLADLTGGIRDFRDTAALLSQLDLLICVDTAVAHLAGALGRPVWLLSRFDGCWRWLLERADSPWYSSLRLFRQRRPGGWGEVVARLAEELAALAAAHVHPLPPDTDPEQAVRQGVRAALEILHAGRAEAARLLLVRLLGQTPRSTLALHALGLLCLKTGGAREAVAWLERAAAFAPGAPDILAALGDACRQAGLPDAAREHLGAALRLAPAHADAWNNLGALELAQGRAGAAASACANAIHFQPDLPMAHFNLGVAYRELNQTAEAAAAFRRAIEIRPDFAEAHVSLGMILLLTGRLPEGFAEYEWRLRLRPPRHAGAPWDGRIVPGATLLVHFEQGFGDAFQFARYLPLVARQGMRVLAQCDRALHGLVGRVEGVAGVFGFDDPLPHFDHHCALLGLPRLFGTTLDRIPAQMPYLDAPPEKSRAWRVRLDSLGATVKIGLCWQGNVRYGADAARSLGLARFGCLADMPGVSWVSLQNRPLLDSERATAERLGLVDYSAWLGDFTDTAALVGQLDLVIAVDTAVAHLAGALDRPVWTLIRYAPDWRWLLERSDSPWYPRMRLFRQKAPGEWEAVVAELDLTLRAVMAHSLMEQE